jgi:hypothetical protein
MQVEHASLSPTTTADPRRPPNAQAYYLRELQPFAASGMPLTGFSSLNWVMITLTMAHLALLAFARPTHRRHRVRIHVVMRALRLTGQVCCTVLTRDAELFWHHRFPSDPRRTLRVALVGPTLSTMAFAFLNPSPTPIQPAFAVAVILIWCTGWLPVIRRMWEEPQMTAATCAACEQLRLWLLGVDAAAIALVGWVSVRCFCVVVLFCACRTADAAQQLCRLASYRQSTHTPNPRPNRRAPATTAGAADNTLTPLQCSCLLQSFASFLMLMAAVALPCAVQYAAELASKRELLHTRGLALRVRVLLLPRLRRWLSLRGIELAWSPLVVGPGLAFCVLLLLWTAAEALVLASNPACRCAARA